MLISADISGLEWVTAAYLSQDLTALLEITTGVDQHSDNQKRFGLPERRLAKVFIFRIIYGGGAWSYANDPDFSGVSKSEKYWQGIIDQFYDKYKGLHRWHTKIVQEVTLNGQLVMPHGRIYTFEKNKYNEWPRTTILNYPVQGLGADLMMIGRISFFTRLKKSGIPALLVSSIHDSLVVDCPVDKGMEVCYNVCRMLKSSIEDIPSNFNRIFKLDFNLPMKCEISMGLNKKEMEVWHG
jgi:DNA polymerase I-like protein with 3'-5' exonuclease and polymerase domains